MSSSHGSAPGQHDRLLTQAEVTHLARVLEPYRVMHRDAFRHAAGADEWHEGSFESALAEAVAAGAIERLPGDFYRIPGWDSDRPPADAEAR